MAVTEREHIEKVGSIFDDWSANGRAEGMEAGHATMAQDAFRKLGLSAGQTYLDIGCGNGYSVRWAAGLDESIQAVGLDVSEGMVERARSLSKDFPNARFIHAPFPLPILKAKAFDAILSIEAFYYFRDLPWALMSTARLLKPGGLFACAIDFYTENEASHQWGDDLGIELNLMSAQEWQDTMTQVGFEIIEQRTVKAPSVPGQPDDWPQTQGSLLTLARRPVES